MIPPNKRRRDGQGETLGRYRLRGVLAQGGMGRLYLAEQIGIEGFTKIVALKRILPHLADSPHFREMFLNEARVAARLEHPNIVTTYELGEVDGSYFISMEYLPGEDLAAVLPRCASGKPMPIEIAAALAQQSANGLHYAHEARDASGRPFGLVHRDVNPSNILVTYYGMVKLLDFGIVKAPNTGGTMPGVFKGKYAYSAPEQIDGDPLDRTTDVFGLGIVLWECLTGRRLFDAPNDAQTMDAVRRAPITPPSSLRPDVPPELDAIVMRALARDSRQRFATASDLSEAIERFLGGREQRPTSKMIGQWLEAVFGAERAGLKKAIAQGTEVDTALDRLAAREGGTIQTSKSSGSVKERAAARPRALWTTSLASGAAQASLVTADGRVTRTTAGRSASITRAGEPGPTQGTLDAAAFGTGTPAAPARPAKLGRTPVVIALTGLGAIAAAVGVAVLPNGRSGPQATTAARATATGGFDLRSDPPGAQVFVDGDPTGLVTPAVLGGLRSGRTVEIRLDKAGYAPVAQKLTVAAGAPQPKTFSLTASAGLVTFEGAPARSAVYIDDSPIETTTAVLLPLGQHRVRIEVGGEVMATRTITVTAGEQTIPLGKGAKQP